MEKYKRTEREKDRMKTYDLKPTRVNLLETLSDDTIGRNIELSRFISILKHVHSCCSISLDGKWGSGKTFFVKQTQMLLNVENENAVDAYSDFEAIRKCISKYKYFSSSDATIPQIAVYYDAWENDNDEDPLLSLIFSILQCVNSEFKFTNGIACVNVAGSIAEVLSGRRGDLLIKARKSEDPLAMIGQEQSIRSKVDELLDALLLEQGSRLVVFIDELDRCNPVFAVKLLERVKHYFCNDHITFVFSTNIDALQHTIKRFYGADFDASRYLDRFFDFRVSLPPVNLNRYFASIDFDDSYESYDVLSGLVIKSLQMEMREIAKFISQLDIAVRKNANHRTFTGRGFELCKLCFIPILIGLNLVDSERYSNFVNGKDSSILSDVFSQSEDTFNLLSDLLNNNETFNRDHLQFDKSLTLVSLEDRINHVYSLVFGTNGVVMTGKGKVGSCSFTMDYKERLLRIAGLLANDAYYGE